jgi:hypothetical protein
MSDSSVIVLPARLQALVDEYKQTPAYVAESHVAEVFLGVSGTLRRYERGSVEFSCVNRPTELALMHATFAQAGIAVESIGDCTDVPRYRTFRASLMWVPLPIIQ